MNKLFTKIASLSVGLTLAIGVGVAVGSHSAVKSVKALDPTQYEVSSTPLTALADGKKVVWGPTTETLANGTIGSDWLRCSTTEADWQIFDIVLSGSSYYIKNGSNYIYCSAAKKMAYHATNKTAVTLGEGGIAQADGIGVFAYNYNSGSGGIRSYASVGTMSNTYFYEVTEKTGPVTTYTISYNSNGGSGEMASTTGSNPAVAACTFIAPSGKTFSRWNTAANGSGTDYAVSATPKADLTLYAIWEDAPTSVMFEGVGDDFPSAVSDTMDTVTLTDTYSSGEFVFNYVQCKKQNNAAPYAIYMAKSVGAFVSNHTEMPGEITSVELFVNSGASANATYDVAFGTSEFTEATAGVGAVNITGGNSHAFESNVSGATYFCITLGAAYNGQIIKLVVNYEEGVDPSKKNMVIYTSGNPADGGTIQWSKNAGTHVFSAKEEETTVSGVTWSVSNTAIATINASTGAMTTLKSGDVVVYAEAEGFNKASATVTISKGWKVESVTVTGSMTKTSYSVGEDWSHAGLVATAEWNTGYEEDVSSDPATIWSYNPASPALNVESVVATATFNEVSGSSSAQSVTVTRTNPIQVLYTKSSGASVDVYGYYVGFLDGTGPVIMDGAYGIVIYNKTADVSGYTAGTTILHVTGSISIYKGLYEIGSATMSVASGTYEVPLEPVVYATNGNETFDYASRLTTVTGTPTLVSGSFDSAAGTADIKMNFAVGTKTVQVFYKAAAQTADADCFAAIKDAVADSEEITIKGFTGWYDGFQVQMNGYVPPAEGYTAEDFAQDLLDQTDAVCTGYKEGDNNHDAIEAIWSDLASNDKYPSLPSAQKTILAKADRDEEGSVVEQAMARYDYLTGRYDLSNFINGRTPVTFRQHVEFESQNNSAIIIIAIVSVTAISLATLIVLKKKKHN